MNTTSTSHSGYLGIIIVPDTHTITQSMQLSNEHAPGWNFQTGAPHMTLYSTHIKDMPHSFILDLLKKVRSRIVGQDIELDSLETFGGKFLFWNAKYPHPGLAQVHGMALEMAKYRDSDEAPLNQGLSFTDAQKENISEYGHPLVREDYKPHITLAYDHTKAESGYKRDTSYSMQIADIVLGRMGSSYGQLEEIVVS